jgi:hypothetical protein
MWTVCGHNDRNKSYGNYWEDSDPVDWPKEVTFKVPTEQRWPSHRKLAAAPVTPAAAQTPGKCPAKLVAVSGKKYSMGGGFSAHHTGPGIDVELAKILVEAANFSLAGSTWKS